MFFQALTELKYSLMNLRRFLEILPMLFSGYIGYISIEMWYTVSDASAGSRMSGMACVWEQITAWVERNGGRIGGTLY